MEVGARGVGELAGGGSLANPAWSTQALLRPVSLMSSPVEMGTVSSSCGAVMVTLTVRTTPMRPTAVSVPGTSRCPCPTQA